MESKHGNTKSGRWRWGSAVVGIMAAIVFVAGVMWWLLDPLASVDERARIAGVQAVLAAGFGVGGMATLMLFVRRQWLQEQAHRLDRDRAELERQIADHNRHDAEEQRITELYMKAAEQLGHDKAPVRLAALYALDRLGQTYPGHRQVVADIWCAYLRRPFTPPTRFLPAPPSESTADMKCDALTGNPPATGATAPDVDEEHEVRATAQRLLSTHLKDPRPRDERTLIQPDETRQYWRLTGLDLTGATLIDTDLAECCLPEITLTNAHLHGSTNFRHTLFTRSASFADAKFDDSASFANAKFSEDTAFADAKFGDSAVFMSAKFSKRTAFLRAEFTGPAEFEGTQFAGITLFERAEFGRSASFANAKFDDSASFANAKFSEDTAFVRAEFTGPARFEGTQFAGHTEFERAKFGGVAWFDKPTFGGLTLFKGAKFGVRVEFRDAVVTDPTLEHVWPTGWHVENLQDQYVLLETDA